MKKILFLLQWPPPVHGSSVVGSYIRNSKLINQEFDCDFVNLSTSKKMDEIGKYKLLKFTTYLRILIKIVYLILIKKYDLVYMAISINGKAIFKDAFIVFLLKVFKKKIVFHLHNKGASQYEGQIRKLTYKFVFKSAKVILLSDYLYDDISTYVKIQDVNICHNGIPSLSKMELKHGEGEKDKILDFLFLSNMIESKGVFILLQACSILRQKGKQFNCHFVGAWKDIEEKDFHQKLKQLQIEDCVFFHGPKYGDEKEKYWKMADVFVFPTFYKQECFPLVLLEAMQYSLPLISTFEGGIPDIVMENENGFLCKQADSTCLAEKMEIFINNPTLSRQLGDKGQKHFDNKFKLDIFEKKLVGILKSILAE